MYKFQVASLPGSGPVQNQACLPSISNSTRTVILFAYELNIFCTSKMLVVTATPHFSQQPSEMG